MDKDIQLVLLDLKYNLIEIDEATENIKALYKREMEKILEWGCRQGFDVVPGILHKIEIMGKAYTIPEALDIYLNPHNANT